MNRNDNFERDIRTRLDCLVHSFDPFVEPMQVALIRNQFNNPMLKNSTTIRIDAKWFFHAIGLTSRDKTTRSSTLWLDTFENILSYINLTNEIVDVLKIDTEGAEWDMIVDVMIRSTANEDDLENNLLCRQVKQLVFEAHPWLNTHAYNYKLVKCLERCFRLFRRDHRFFIELEKTEWQADEFRLDLKLFKDELDLARFLFTYGELYFVNVNFLV